MRVVCFVWNIPNISSFEMFEKTKKQTFFFLQANISILMIELLCFNVLYLRGIRVHDDESDDPTTQKPLLAKPIFSTSNGPVNSSTSTLIENKAVIENMNTSWVELFLFYFILFLLWMIPKEVNLKYEKT